MPRIVPARMRAIVIVAIAGLTIMAPSAPSAGAQATPTAPDFDIPAPQDCEVAPREFPFFAEGSGLSDPATPAPMATPSAEPFTLPTGEAPDDETIAALTSTARESLACRNANELLRAYALFTDDMLVSLFGGPETIDPDVRAVIADEEIRPVPPRQRLALIGVKDAVSLPDGRVGAVVETLNARYAYVDFLIFERDPESDRWLIDETIVLGQWVIGDG